jgi:hypothetical protein
LALLALAAGDAAGEAAVLAAGAALRLAALAFAAVLFEGAGVEHAAVRSSAPATPQIKVSFFI